MFAKVDKEIGKRMESKLEEMGTIHPHHVRAPDAPGRMGSHGHQYEIAQR
jgi:hypothetical protein